MKALSACLYCTKKKECADSVQAHSFTDACFIAEDEDIRAIFGDLQQLSKIALPVEVSEKVHGVADTILEQSNKISVLQKKLNLLQKYIADGGCELICRNAREYPCTSFIECYECDEQCECRECKDNSKFSINWDKLAEIYPENSVASVYASANAMSHLFTERNKIN
jgi:hypothetical protein